MSYVINRNPSGRLICLHALTQYLNNRFGAGKEFTLSEMKYDRTATKNIHQTCTLLKRIPSVSSPICPYLENPLSKAKCYLTQSIQEDKQKSKSVSDSFNALEGLGFIDRTENGGQLNQAGKKFAETKFHSPEMFSQIQTAVLRYGPFIGLLQDFLIRESEISRSTIRLGYPDSKEAITRQGRTIILSTGSQKDTITRTRSVLLSWATTAGFALPKGYSQPKEQNTWHTLVLPYITAKKWTSTRFATFLPSDLLENHFVERPLSYDAMTKSTKALRERNQEQQRQISLEFEPKIKNRRYAIVYILAKCAEKKKRLNIEQFIQKLQGNKAFVVNQRTFRTTLLLELPIAQLAGIPFNEKGGSLEPLTTINTQYLRETAPREVLKILDDIFDEVCEWQN